MMIWDWFRRGRERPGGAGQPQVVRSSKPRKYRAGDTIAGVYRVLRVFEGGLGIVYVVEHTSGDRIVLKTLKDGSLQAVQFRREAETWVRLGSHANIVKAFWVDEVAGMVCVAAELIEPDEIGRSSLRDYLQLGALTPLQIARYTAQFCYGLEHAIGRGLVSHRDIKPENLLIGSTGILKITDFGIASAAPIADDSQSPHLKLGRWQAIGGGISGTPPYMAPEQIAGSHKQDQRVDIYAFGVVLYEMAYGRLPFAGRTPTEFFHLHLHTEPKIPSGPFAELIDRCLMKTPDHRYSSATELFVDLQRICRARNLALPPRPEAPDVRLEELRARAHSLDAVGRPEEAIESARELVRQAPRDASSWTQVGRLLLERGDLRGAKEAANRSLALDPTRSAPWNNLGILLKREGKWHEAIEALDRAVDCDPQNTGAMLNASEPLVKVGKTIEAVRRLRRATEIAPDKFSIWTNLASLYVHLEDRVNALECFQKARDLAPQRYQGEIDERIRDARQLPET
jgi:serine/threonine-protein kinase